MVAWVTLRSFESQGLPICRINDEINGVLYPRRYPLWYAEVGAESELVSIVITELLIGFLSVAISYQNSDGNKCEYE
jgi:hypothetical protein